MPIVDGLTSTKMIRAQEGARKRPCLSTRALLNGRIPVIAVSASLLERERQTYIDAGFDGWILKPINFIRLKELLTAIVDPPVRASTLYQPGGWEKGGFFGVAQPISLEPTTPPRDDGAEDVESNDIRKTMSLPSRIKSDLFGQSSTKVAHPDPASVMQQGTVESPAAVADDDVSGHVFAQ